MRLNKFYILSSNLTEQQFNVLNDLFEQFYKSIHIEDSALWCLSDWLEEKDSDDLYIKYQQLPKFEPLIDILGADFYLRNASITKIFLISEEDFETVQSKYPYLKNKYRDAKNPAIELLGCYLEYPFPQILICPERIARHSSADQFNYLFLLVLLHELVHADLADKKYIQNTHDDFYCWMEESLANFIALQSLDFFLRGDKQKHMDELVSFCQGQPDNYKLGAHLYLLNKERGGEYFCKQYINWKKSNYFEYHDKFKWLREVSNFDESLDNIISAYDNLFAAEMELD
jgi:hypothetical protein